MEEKGKKKGKNGESMRDMKGEKRIIILLVTNLDGEDFAAVVGNLKDTGEILVVCDQASMAGCPPHIWERIQTQYLADPLTSPEALAERVREWEKKNHARIIGLAGYDEEYHYRFSEALACAFSLPFHTRRTLDLTSNKYLQRVALSESGVAVPLFCLVSPDALDVQTVQTSAIPFPNVLKVITGYASCFIYLNRNREELKRHLEIFRRMGKEKQGDTMFSPHVVNEAGTGNSSGDSPVVYNPCSQIILEEYLGGEEYSCDYIVDKGNVEVLRLVHKITNIPPAISPASQKTRRTGGTEGTGKTSGFAFFEGFYLYNPAGAAGKRVGGPGIAALKDVCTRTASALGITRGVCMMDFKYENNNRNNEGNTTYEDSNVYVLETTVRPGISTFVELMARVYGFTSITRHIDQIKGIPVSAGIPEKTGLVVYLTSPCTGTVRTIDTSLLRERGKDRGEGHGGCEVISVNPYYREGDVIPEAEHRRGKPVIVGDVLLGQVQPESIGQVFARIRGEVRVKVTTEVAEVAAESAEGSTSSPAASHTHVRNS